MAIKLNLVKSRLISSHEELAMFKKEATTALLKFAESNDCDLDAISQLLTARYAEINQALTEGYQVESEVEIYPQPAPLEQKTACMQRIAEPIHPPLPIQQDEANPEAQDPADLVEAQQEREIAESQITPEDLAKLIAETPEKQEMVSDIVSATLKIGQSTAWALLCKVAANELTDRELLDLKAALKILAVDAEDEENPEADADVVTEAPVDAEDQAAGQAAAEFFSVPGELKAANDIVDKFNEMLKGVDPDGEMLTPINLHEIVRSVGVSTGREREALPPLAEPEQVPTSKQKSFENVEVKDAILPAYNKLSPEEKSAVIEGVEPNEVDNIIDSWYAEQGLDVIADMATGVNPILEEMKETQITGQQVVERFLADTGGKGHITPSDVKFVIGEIRKEAAPAPVAEEPAAVEAPKEPATPEA